VFSVLYVMLESM